MAGCYFELESRLLAILLLSTKWCVLEFPNRRSDRTVPCGCLDGAY